MSFAYSPCISVANGISHCMCPIHYPNTVHFCTNHIRITPLFHPIPTVLRLCILLRNVNACQHFAAKVTSINRHEINVCLLECATILLGS